MESFKPKPAQVAEIMAQTGLDNPNAYRYAQTKNMRAGIEKIDDPQVREFLHKLVEVLG